MIVESVHSPSSAVEHARAPIRVATAPVGHPYVRGIAAADGDGFAHLAEVLSVGRPTGQWWPPAIATAEWITEHADEFDVMHLHFGLESLPLADLDSAITALHAARRPLVFTVHDLENPQLLDQTHHLAQVGMLVRRSDAVITLTPGAAAEIERRWERTATVIAHPSMVDDVAALGARQRSVSADPGPVVVGMHLKDLRPNVDAVAATRTLIAAVERLRASDSADTAGIGVLAVIHLNDRVRHGDTVETIAQMCSDSPGSCLIQRPRPSDSRLADELLQVDIEVLPYSFGTHSGWLELCWDLAVPVAVPTVGYFGEQHPDDGSARSFTPGSARSLASAISGILSDTHRADRGSLRSRRQNVRTVQREVSARQHAAVYQTAIEAAARAAIDGVVAA